MINEMIVLGCSHSYGTGINTRNLIKIAKKHNVKLPDYNDWIEYVEKYVSNMLDQNFLVRSRMCGNLIDEFNEKFIKVFVLFYFLLYSLIWFLVWLFYKMPIKLLPTHHLHQHSPNTSLLLCS